NIQNIVKRIENSNLFVRFSDAPLYLNTIEPVQAINYPEKMMIIIHKDSWLKLNDEQKTTLIFHEIFSLLHLEDSKYTYSSEFINNLVNIQSSPVVKWKNKIKFQFSSNLDKVFYISNEGIFLSRIKITSALSCLVNINNFTSKKVMLSDIKTIKYYSNPNGILSQLNTINLEFSSQNEIGSIKISCSYFSQPGPKNQPEDLKLQDLINILRPILINFSL
ncbi:MAG: hypothetical protein KDD45_05565, partial [Bdellovibrionales bacterium]|nr:hypothetical protein [Bdellovibrionales bacterium]